MQLDYELLRSTPAAAVPFLHVVVPQFVPPRDLEQVARSLPAIEHGGSFPPDALRLAGGIRALVDELGGPRFRGAIADKFGLDLDDAPSMITLRGRTRGKDGRIHRDSPAKLVTVLLYLNPPAECWDQDQGCLRLLRNADDIEDYAVQVPPVDGNLLVFPNGPATWHGHKPFVGRRYAIQLNYMAAGAKARSELRRHRLSALFKRLMGTARGTGQAVRPGGIPG